MEKDAISLPLDKLKTLALQADRMVVAVLLLGAMAAIALGLLNGPVISGSAMAIALAAAGLMVWRIAPGTLFSRLSLSVIGMLMVALHIQLSMGLTEMHFGVFVFLAFLLVYRDWRPIGAAATTIALHHIAFDRLQAFGWPVFCMTAPNFVLVLVVRAIATLSQLTSAQAQGIQKISKTLQNPDAMTQSSAQLVIQPSLSAVQLLEQASTLQSIVLGAHSGQGARMQRKKPMAQPALKNTTSAPPPSTHSSLPIAKPALHAAY